MTGRKCGTCKHFEPAPLWRKGWCRNPLLFSPQQSHLVNDEDLDCERGMGNYWEAADAAQTVESPSFAQGFREPVATAFKRGSTSPTHLVSDIGQPVYPVTGAAGHGSDRPPYDDPPPGGGWSGDQPPAGPGPGDYNYYPEERYWTDYLRIAAPILGVILMVFLFWWWISNFIGDDNGDNGSIAGDDNTPVTIPTVGSTPEPDAEPTTVDGTPGGIVFPPAGGTPGTDNQSATPPPGGATEPPDTTDPPAEETGEIYNGATVEVANTGGTGVNVRSQASTESDIITVFLDGTVLTVIGEPVESEGFVWWPVSGDGVEGYVVQEYLTLIE